MKYLQTSFLFLFLGAIAAKGAQPILIAHYIAEDISSIPDSFLDYAASNGYGYVLAHGNNLTLSSGLADWRDSAGMKNGFYDWSPSAPHKLYNSLKDLFARADKRHLSVIPYFSTGSRWAGTWISTNTKIQNNVIRGTNYAMPPMAPDPNGMDRSFDNYLEVVFKAFQDAKTTYSTTLDFINIGHDEMMGNRRFLIAANSALDRKWLQDRMKITGESCEEAYYDLIADEISRRVASIKKVAATYSQGTKVLILADMFDPQLNGDPAGNGGLPYWAWAPGNFWLFPRVTLCTMHVLKRQSMQKLKNDLILMPWEYRTRRRDSYDAVATVRYFTSLGFQVIPGCAYEDWADDGVTEGRLMMKEWLRVGYLPEFKNAVIGYCAFNWWDGGHYWLSNPRPELFKIIPELAEETQILESATGK